MGEVKVKDLVERYADLESRLNDVTLALSERRKNITQSMADVRKDQRYSVQVLVKEHDRLAEELDALLNKTVAIHED